MLASYQKIAAISICVFSCVVNAEAVEVWAPYKGYSNVTHTQALNAFYFSKNAIQNFTSRDTYEQESQVYDTEFANYNYDWSSNMLGAYYDTPFLDKIDNFTIGSYIAASLSSEKLYYTYMALKKQKSNSATVRIKGQKGKRTPSGCYSTWCIFAEATTGTMAKFTAPGKRGWY